MNKKQQAHLPSLYYLTHDEDWRELRNILSRLPMECGVIFRHYDSPERAAMATKIAQYCNKTNQTLLIAGDSRLAKKVGARGLYWPDFMKPPSRLEVMPFSFFITSAHHMSKLHRLRHLDVSAIMISPVFPTKSHPATLKNSRTTLGPHRLARFAALSKSPVIALGGISVGTARRLSNIANLIGIAGISLFKAY